MATTIEPKELANAFSKIIREWLTEEELAEVRELNAGEPKNVSICHSHDFCDANQAMIDALESLGVEYGSEDFGDGDKGFDILNAAWDLAKANGFEAIR